MSLTNRRARIIEQLERAGSVSVPELVSLFEVSEMTIRRDLADLEDQGMLRRYRGGAVWDRQRNLVPPYAQRKARNSAEKRRIGAAAARLISPGETLAIDYGTTAIEAARHLTSTPGLTVLTPDIHVALELVESPTVKVIVTGGVLRPGELMLTGRDTERTFERHFVDKAIIGSGGIDADRGLTDFNIDEIAVKQAMISSVRHVIAVADASKLGVVAFSSLADFNAIDTLVTTADPRDPTLCKVAEHGVEIVLA
ncbi:DeoR/GlpR family DNA-binding transcription regulator [Phytoactinopolyspora mesophila]|nr:DeoR/GlpR family DNA-binding transcription regulator [Phytoactinopolyspora mesophila]